MFHLARQYSECVRDIDAENLTSVVDAASGLVELAKGMSDIDTDDMIDFGKALKKLGNTGVNEFVSAFYDAESRVKLAAITMLNQFIDAINNNKSNFKTTFSGVLESLITVIKDSYARFKYFAGNLMNQFVDGVMSYRDSVITTINDIISDSVDAIRNKRNSFYTAGKYLAAGFTNGISANSNLAKEKSIAMAKSADAIREEYDSFHDAGGYLVTGFANGISANSNLAKEKSIAMAKSALDAANRTLQINSPSKAFYAVGNYSGLGFINALDDYASKAYGAGSEIAESAKNGLRNAISKVTDMLNSDIDTQPAIRPVLDLSDVERGTSRIKSIFSRTQALSINAEMLEENGYGIQNEPGKFDKGASFNFTQNNYSPKALSRIDIYRQTKNQFTAMKEAIEKS